MDEWEFAAIAGRTSKDAFEKPEFTDFILKSYQNKKNYRNAVGQDDANYYGIHNL